MSVHESFTTNLIIKKKTKVFWSLIMTLIWLIGNRLDDTDNTFTRAADELAGGTLPNLKYIDGFNR